MADPSNVLNTTGFTNVLKAFAHDKRRFLRLIQLIDLSRNLLEPINFRRLLRDCPYALIRTELIQAEGNQRELRKIGERLEENLMLAIQDDQMWRDFREALREEKEARNIEE